ncbi:MAG: DUF6134 family protein [Geminicoccaceae bacterium]
MTRRQASVGLATLALSPTIARATADEDSDILFDVLRNGDKIGTHRLSFSEQGDEITVSIAIDLEVKFAFFTVYSYRHRNTERWRGNRLVALDSRTNDNGTDHEVRARATGEGLEVTGNDGRLVLPADTISTSYWQERTMERTSWLDTQRGKLISSKVAVVGTNEVQTVAAGPIQAKKYSLVGDLTCELWYSRGRWVKLNFEASDGSAIEYRLMSDPIAV